MNGRLYAKCYKALGTQFPLSCFYRAFHYCVRLASVRCYNHSSSYPREGRGMEYTPVSEYASIDNYPTQILKFGELPQEGESVLFLVIPGNPGIIGYYEIFMEMLFRLSGGKVPVWGIAHSGHEIIPDHLNHNFKDAGYQTFTLHDQIRFKFEIIKQHVPANTKIIFIGHSIGCYIILRLMQVIEPSRVLKSLLLFPTIERMAESPHGTVATPLLKYMRWVGLIAAWAVSYLSPHVQYRLITWYFSDRRVSQCVYNATMHLFRASCVGNVLYMANKEMQQVTELNTSLLEPWLEKITFYYGQHDHWCPIDYYRDMRLRYPGADVRMCDGGFEHAFCLDSGIPMAERVWSWCEGLGDL